MRLVLESREKKRLIHRRWPWVLALFCLVIVVALYLGLSLLLRAGGGKGAAIGSLSGSSAGGTEPPPPPDVTAVKPPPLRKSPPSKNARPVIETYEKVEGVVRHEETLAAAEPGTPVYNAAFSPTPEGFRDAVFDQQPSKVRFFIGPYAAESAITSQNWTVDPGLLSEKSNVPLVVTMICPFCLAPRMQVKPITYLGAEQRSTEADFDFIPLMSRLEGRSRSGRIAFEITKDGVQLDYVVVDLVVVRSANDLGRVQEPVHPGQSAVLSAAEWSRDVDLVIRVRQNSNRLEFQFEPGNSDVGKMFEKKHLAPDGSGDFRWFRAGLSPDDLKGLNKQLYTELFALTRNDAKLKELLAGTSDTVASPNDVVLTETDRLNILQPFVDAGGELYRMMFVDGAEQDLHDIIAKFESYQRKDGAPVRLRILTDSFYVPWQTIIDSGTDDPDKMWGFKYEMSVDPTNGALPGPFKGPLAYHAGPLLFGGYRDTDKNELVMTLAASEADVLQHDLNITGVETVNSRGDFLSKIQSERKTVQMIVTFTHGVSGTTFRDDGQVSEDPEGPKLQFAKSEFVPATLLNRLLGHVPSSEASMFTNSPVVFLNGCETGTAGFYPTSNLHFAGTFLRMGARGVIVTEAPIWTYFGYNFGILLMRDIKAGDTVPSSVLSARQYYLKKLNNPLGLLYSYYGGPDVTVHFN